MSNTETFRANVAASPELQQRWHAVTDTLISEAQERWGVNLTKEDLANSDNSALRLMVLTGEKIADPLEQMARTMPQIKRAIESRELRDAITREDHANHAAAVAEWDAMSPSAKMQKARQIEDSAPMATQAEPRELTREEHAKALHRLQTLRGSARITEARRLGLAG